MPKLLTIVIPTYNMEKYLSACLSSLILKDKDLLFKLDIIVVNDGSRDKSGEIAHDFSSRYPSVIRVLDKHNGNYGSCINVGIEKAQGRFIKILDADDSFKGNAFLEFVRRINGLKEIPDVILSPFDRVDEQGSVISHEKLGYLDGQWLTIDEFAESKTYVPMHSVCYRTGLLREIGYHQTEGISYTDTEWVYAPLAYAKTLLYLDNVVYRYLFGRVGQTVDARVVAKSFGSYQTLLRNMLVAYSAFVKDPDANRQILDVAIDRIVRLVYMTEALELPLKDALTQFEITYGNIHQCASPLVERYDELRISHRFGGRFVRNLRSLGMLRGPYLVLLRMYNSVVVRLRNR